MKRIDTLRSIMKEKKLDAFLISSFHNLYYLSNHTSDEAILFITSSKCYILSDFRYKTQIKEECYKEFEFIEILKGDFVNPLNKLVNENKVKNVGFEGDYIAFNFIDSFIKNINCKFESISLTHLHDVKDKEELKNIEKASRIAEKAFEYIVKDVVKVGVSEKEIAIKLETKMKELGASKPSFDTIVASNIRGALPHAKPTDNKLKNGDMVTIDFGAYYNYYCSDLTRTFVVGDFKNEKLREIYDIVLEAQQMAIKAIKPGIKCCEIDKIARDYIASKGYGDCFGHGLGHGIGIQIHESPRFNQTDETILKENMVITVEPGIYVEGLGGCRIEDDIIVTNKGAKVIAKLPKKFMNI